MKDFSNKAGWIALGLVVGVGTSLLFGANQLAAENADRYDVDLDISIGGAVLSAHDREENRMIIYHITDEDEAKFAGEIDLSALGQATLPVTFVDKQDTEADAEE